jgi:hypothetical protein
MVIVTFVACDDDPTDFTPNACGPIETFESGLTANVEIHVSPSGDDGAGDGSESSPFATISRAVRDAVRGTAIRVHEGVYSGGTFLSDVRGAESAPIWIGGVDGESRPLIDGGGEGIHLSEVSYVVLHDIEVANSANNGINTDDGGDYGNVQATHHVVFRDLYVHDVGGTGNQDCLKLSGVNHFWVLNSAFERCGGGGSGSGIDHVGCHNGLLAGNSFREMSGNAVQAKGGSENIEIHGNTIVDGGARALNMGGSTGDAFFRPPLSTTSPNFEARNIRAVANIIEGATAAIAFVGCVDCLAANNTIVDPQNWIFRILQETTTHDGYEFLPAQDGYAVNNLVYFERAALSTDVNVGPNTDANSFVFENNLWYAWDDPGQSAPSLPGTEVGSIVGLDPALVTDYRIDASSPAVGAGIRLSDVRSDAVGVCYANPPSIGAFEVF